MPTSDPSQLSPGEPPAASPRESSLISPQPAPGVQTSAEGDLPLHPRADSPLQGGVDLLFNQGVEHARGERWKQAEDRLRLALALAPWDVQARVLLGKVLARQERYTEAAACIDEALRYDPACVPAREGLRALEDLQRELRQARGGKSREQTGGGGPGIWGLLVAAPLLLAAGFFLGRRRGAEVLLQGMLGGWKG